MLKKNTEKLMVMYVLMYYLPERIFLCKFKYFAQSRTLARGGGGGRSDRLVFMSLKPALSC
jgi:hypothetical protein